MKMASPTASASSIIRMSGLTLATTEKINGNGDIEIKIIGLRKGEKLHEEVYYGVNRASSTNKDIFKDDDLQNLQYNDFSLEFKSIDMAIKENNINKIKSTFEKYTNYDS